MSGVSKMVSNDRKTQKIHFVSALVNLLRVAAAAAAAATVATCVSNENKLKHLFGSSF